MEEDSTTNGSSTQVIKVSNTVLDMTGATITGSPKQSLENKKEIQSIISSATVPNVRLAKIKARLQSKHASLHK